jgi:hypothetical protein
MYKYYRFYNKKGEYFNFEYDSANDKWIGRIDMNIISQGLIENSQIYVLEEVANSLEQAFPSYPHSYIGSTASELTAYFDPNNPVEDIFLYNIDLEDSTLIKSYTVIYDLDSDAGATYMGATSHSPGMKKTSVLNSRALQINIGFHPSAEERYTSILYIKDDTNHVLAEITIYGEGETEDERLRAILSSLGNDILPSDTIIFDTSDVNEINTDWNLINRKRKELLLEYHNIFPYLGSYKALINILKFYGYQNVHMKEYWKNVNVLDTKNFGKYRQTDIIDLFTTKPDPVLSKLIPSKIYKKTNLFGLYYDINVETDEFDDNGIPLTQEVFTFTPEEVLIKIFALKRKLINYFLPLNAKIVDIIGEAIYFANYEIRNVTSQNRIDSVSLGLKPKYEIIPNKKGYIQDLRALEYLGAPIGPDLTAGGYSSYLIYRLYVNNPVDAYIGSVDTAIRIGSTYAGRITFFNDPRRLSEAYTRDEVVERIVESFNNPQFRSGFNTQEGIEWIKQNYHAYAEPDNPGWIRIVQDNPLAPNTASLVVFPIGAISLYPGPTSSASIDISPGASFGAAGAPLSFYKTAYVGFFNKFNISIEKLNDAPNISVGYPIILRNTTFDITFDDANATFNQVDVFGPTGRTLYSDYTNSFIALTGPSGWNIGSFPNFQGVTGFPEDYPHQFNYSWDNIGYYSFYDMQWIVYKDEDETPAFYYDSGQKNIEELNEIPLSLPYTGKYSVKLFLWDLYNNRSFIIDEQIIEVEIPEVDFIGWYTKRELDYTFDSLPSKVQSDVAERRIIPGTPLKELTFNDYYSTWNLPLHPNENLSMGEISFNSLDSIEFYQTIENPIDNPLVDRYPYKFNLLGESARLDDTYHLWWDSTGTRITEFRIDNAYTTGPTSGIIYMTRANCTLDSKIAKGATIVYVVGPTGWTGATSSSILGVTGQIAYVASNRRVYIHNGSHWKYVSDQMDAVRVTVLGGTANRRADTKTIATALNNHTGPIISDFIYYYNEEYDSNYSLIPYIKAVSKDFDKTGRHRIYYQNFVGEPKSYETTYFGYLGDIPTHFEIYKMPISGTSSFTLSYLKGNMKGGTSFYRYITGTTSLSDLCDELNGPTAQALPVIGDFTYNMVHGSSGWSGGAGPSAVSDVKLQGIAKAFVEPQQISITYSSGFEGNSYGRSLIKNPSWNDIRILKYSDELPLLTTVNFTFDNCKISGKTNFEWLLEKEDDLDFENIYYNNPYFSYMFTRKGSYSISLKITDSNGNTNFIKKKELIKIK